MNSSEGPTARPNNSEGQRPGNRTVIASLQRAVDWFGSALAFAGLWIIDTFGTGLGDE